MLKIINRPTVNCWDVYETTGIDCLECEFAQMIENDSYVIVPCDEDHLEYLNEDIAYETELESRYTLEDFYGDEEEFARHRKRCRLARLENEKKFVLLMREQYNITDNILVFISW